MSLDALVVQTLTAFGISLAELADLHFDTVHRWLPVVDKNSFHDTHKQLREDHGSALDEELAVLTLSMFLASRVPCVKREYPVEKSPIYRVTKRLSLISLSEQPSLLLLQAGILVTAYELGHGLTRQAYLSLATCFSVAKLMGLAYAGSVLSQGDGEGQLAVSACAGAPSHFSIGKGHRTAIIHISDADNNALCSMIALCAIDWQAPLLIPPPDEPYVAASLRNVTAFLKGASFLVGPFRAFQVTVETAFLIGSALTYVHRRSTTSVQQCATLDSHMQQLVQSLLHTSQRKYLRICEAAALAISALAALRSTHSEGNAHDLDSASALALRSISNMVLDMARIALESCDAHDSRQHSFIAFCTESRATLYVVEHLGRGLSEQEVDVLRSSTLRFGRRWAIGCIYPSHLESLLR
ncbi:Uu.00g009370.m01.CDS01 [Anthostomella pinea]|uniref:Uu.00g009370.m01.CDS01 n=1 Tax=Anthostomella pinea TaxID=933095 RepID=A0AAI8VXD7_9PEZI|nr:Uu.00g009370.m01.CDS01 [Anthostomella pinea]